MKSSFPLNIVSLAVMGLVANSVSAQNLVDLYQAAKAYDASFAAVKSQYDANIARSEQSKSALDPTINLGINHSLNQFSVARPVLDRTYITQSGTLSANKPLYRPASKATAQQGELQANQAQFALQTAEQDLMLRVSQAYFDVLASKDSLEFVKAQKTAVSEQLASAKRNFEVGTSTITDTREAQARFDLVIAQEIAAENDLRVKKIALDQLVGKTNVEPKGLLIPVRLPETLPKAVDPWVEQSSDHPSLKASRIGIDILKLETTKARAGNQATLDFTTSYNVTRNLGGSVNSAASTKTYLPSVGLLFNVPLYTGGGVDARIKENLSLEEKAANDLEAAKRNIAQATRTAFFGLVSGQGQVKALEAAEASSQSALDANKLGYQVGVRINIDVLNSQSQLFQTKRDLAKARYDVLIGGLRLRQANGSLKAEDLQVVNALLQR